MRKLATALGCLVIAAYATVAEGAMNHDHGGNLIAKCHFGDNGYVVFRQVPTDKDHRRVNQYKRENIGGTGMKKRKLIQQAADEVEADEVEDEVAADVAEDGALNEGKARDQEEESVHE